MNTVTGVITQSILLVVLFVVSTVGIVDGMVALGWTGVVLSLVWGAYVMFLVSTGRVRTPRGLTAGFSLYSEDEQEEGTASE